MLRQAVGDELDDPDKDGWPTEAFAQRAKKQLLRLAGMLEQARTVSAGQLEPLTADGFHCAPLLPGPLSTVWQDDLLHVQRHRRSASSEVVAEPVGTSSKAEERDKTYTDTSGLATALNELLASFPAAQGLRCEFKIFRVEPGEDEVTTTQYVSCSAKTGHGMMEQHATWVIRWSHPDSADAPRLRQVVVDDFEMVRLQEHEAPLFSDCTEAILAANAGYSEQLLRGLNHWLQRSQQRRFFFRLGTPGIAVGDVDGDGLDDVYLCQEDGLPNKLFIHQRDGTAVDASSEWGVDWLHDSRSALLVDWDNDGDQDLAVAILGGVVLAMNDNNQRFVLRDVIETNDDIMSLAAADYDADGDVDLYVCSYFPGASLDLSKSSQIPATSADFVYHDANNGGRNVLLRNDIHQGIWKFTDVTKEVGLDQNNTRFSFAAAWEDYDNDGDQDLYVANDYGRDNLYRQDNGHFMDVGSQAGAEDAAAGMGITWGDFNRDGWMDAHVSNMWSSAGGRITYQPQFHGGVNGEVKRRLQRMARGNTLLRNGGHGSFQDVSASAGVEMGRWAWGSLFFDMNNDGWEDLIVANGFITGEDPADL